MLNKFNKFPKLAKLKHFEFTFTFKPFDWKLNWFYGDKRFGLAYLNVGPVRFTIIWPWLGRPIE